MSESVQFPSGPRIATFNSLKQSIWDYEVLGTRRPLLGSNRYSSLRAISRRGKENFGSPLDLVFVLGTSRQSLKKIGSLALLSLESILREVYHSLKSELPFLLCTPPEHRADEFVRHPENRVVIKFLFFISMTLNLESPFLRSVSDVEMRSYGFPLSGSSSVIHFLNCSRASVTQGS